MTDEPDEDSGGADGQVRGRRVWRWAAPIGLAIAVVVTAAVGVRLLADEPDRGSLTTYATKPPALPRTPRFVITAGAPPEESWLQIYEVKKNNGQQPTDSVRSPSPSPGQVQEIVAGPGGTFVVAASRAEPCESRLYRFRLTGEGHATAVTPVPGGIAPALVAGLAISPDGRRIAYTTAPCATDPSTPPTAGSPPQAASPPSATLTVLDTTTGRPRTWTTGGTSVIGEIVWARDSRMLGYTTGDVTPRTTPPPADDTGEPPGDPIGNVTVRALDTDAPGADLLASRVLFRPPGDAGTVTSAVMNPDGRTGYGRMSKGRPPSTIMFSFAEGQPMHVTESRPPDPEGTFTLYSFDLGDEPRYACLSGIDAFGRVDEGSFRSRSFGRCSSAWGY
ncbi:hypothetical protein ABZ897_26630 [Nonomuraea sp. NPDC046802]|uniref:hypothetical protein n=1 Tax=Nonomuraea sp. NPDC046802 TaxID=3154919 RepID=UPI0033C93D5B